MTQDVPPEELDWRLVGSVADLTKRRKVVLELDERQILVLAHEGRFFAFDNICVHRERELSKGVVLNGKLVCPGHQWAFALDTGWEAVKETCQPTHAVRVDGDEVYVCAAPQFGAGRTNDLNTLDQQSVKAWVDDWGAEVASVDLTAARRRFIADVVAFGTFADVVVGLDRLHDEQWSQVWPKIDSFRFLTHDMEVLLSPDRMMAVAIVGWDSLGIAEDGSRFPRPGRATAVLRRDSVDAAWLGTHTHFSLGRGVPQSSHGTRPIR